MYKSPTELIQKNPEIYKAILETIEHLHNKKTGFRGLGQDILKAIPELTDKKYQNTEFKVRTHTVILKTIKEWEESGKKYSKEIFTKDVIDKIKNMLFLIKKNPKEYEKKYTTDDFDNLKFAMNGATVNKYRYYISCGNAATAFADLAKDKISSDKIMLLNSTCWNHLHDGMVGHTVPCIKMEDGNFYAIDPQKGLGENKTVKFIKFGQNIGDTIYHILQGHKNKPYMITKFTTPQEYQKLSNSRDDFLNNLGKVSPDKAKTFLRKIIPEVDLDDMKKYLSKMVKQNYLNQSQQKNLLTRIAQQKIINKIKLKPKEKNKYMPYGIARENN